MDGAIKLVEQQKGVVAGMGVYKQDVRMVVHVDRTSASFKLAHDDITVSAAGIMVRCSCDMERQSVVKPLRRRREVVVARTKGRLRRPS